MLAELASVPIHSYGLCSVMNIPTAPFKCEVQIRHNLYISLCLLLDIPMEHLEHGKNTVVPVYMYLKSRLSMVFPIIDSPMAVKFASPTVVI